MEQLHLALQLLAALTFIYLVQKFLRKPPGRPFLHTVAVVVLGDIGRSPRMMYHAESFAKNDFETFLIGYGGSKPVPSLLSIPHVHFLYLRQFPSVLSSLPFVFLAPLKIIHQISTILDALFIRIPPVEFIIVQNPPSIPTLALVWLVGRVRGSKVIIDWHNLGYSILALRLGPTHPFVKLAKKFEATFGKNAYAHLFVTKAMHDRLISDWDLQGHKAILHDRPPAHFHRASPSEVHDLFLRLRVSLISPTLTQFLPPSSPPYSTPLTSIPSPGSTSSAHIPVQVQAHDPLSSFEIHLPGLREDRPALLVSSTSWTPDEDFGILIDALSAYERLAAGRACEEGGAGKGPLPKVLMIVTGKGPLREKYMQEVQRREMDDKWEWVRCRSMWLEAEDYPLLLGSADLGISLHSSSSALDLPMKVVDMFGCGLPVCALNFACLDELVKDGQNGRVFRDHEELVGQLDDLLTNFPSSPVLSQLRSSLLMKSTADSMEATRNRGRLSPGPDQEEWVWGTWAENWDKVVKPIVSKDAAESWAR